MDSVFSMLSTEFELDFLVPEMTHYHRYFISSPFKLQIVSTYIIQLLLSLHENSTVNPSSRSAEAIAFKKAIDYMNKNIASQISIPEIAEYCNISPSGLKRIFAKSTGHPVHKYFLKMKLNAASMCLKNGESITDISTKFGFSSQSYFSVVFKRETGYTPTEFKAFKDK